MRSLLQRALLTFVFCISSFTSYAQNDAEVSQWVKKTLLESLAVDYTTVLKDDKNFRDNFSENAREALYQFLGNYIPIVKQQRLSLHPQYTIEPYIAKKGIALGIHFWRVNEAVYIPELELSVAFSIIVIENSSINGKFIIHSMDMVKQGNM